MSYPTQYQYYQPQQPQYAQQVAYAAPGHHQQAYQAQVLTAQQQAQAAQLAAVQAAQMQQAQAQAAAMQAKPSDDAQHKLHQLVTALLNTEYRENALQELSKQRENYPELAPVLWFSTGVIAVLLQEIIAVYPALNPPTLEVAPSNRICNALSLLQCVAAHPTTRNPFLAAHIPMFLYPFLNTTCKDRPFEYLRLTSLGVIGALVKSDDGHVITFLLSTEMVPLCLKIMENGTELSKTVATFVVQKILLFDSGLGYVCATPERFLAVATVLSSMVSQKDCSARLLRHIVRCYLRLTEHNRARDALKQTLPHQLRDNTFASVINEDPNIKKWLYQLLVNLEDPGALSIGGQQEGQAAAAAAQPARPAQ